MESQHQQTLANLFRAGAGILVVGPIGPGKAKVIRAVLGEHYTKAPLRIIDHRGEQTDISSESRLWNRTTNQPLSDLLSPIGTIYPVVHALTNERELAQWARAASYYGGIATAYLGRFSLDELTSTWCTFTTDQQLAIVTLTKDSVVDPEVEALNIVDAH